MAVQTLHKPFEATQLPDTRIPTLRNATVVLFRELQDCAVPGGAQWLRIRNQLVADHLDYARYLSGRFGAPQDAHEDLYQVACLALVKAVDNFDPDHGAPFLSYLTPSVNGEIKRYFRDATWAVHVPRRMQELRIDLRAATDELGRSLQRTPTSGEVSAHLGITNTEAGQAAQAGRAYSAGTLDRPAFDDDPSGTTVGDLLGGEDPGLEGVVNRAALQPLLRKLGGRDKQILVMRFFRGMTQTEIGVELGVSQMQVSRLLAGILGELRTRLADSGSDCDTPGPATVTCAPSVPVSARPYEHADHSSPVVVVPAQVVHEQAEDHPAEAGDVRGGAALDVRADADLERPVGSAATAPDHLARPRGVVRAQHHGAGLCDDQVQIAEPGAGQGHAASHPGNGRAHERYEAVFSRYPQRDGTAGRDVVQTCGRVPNTHVEVLPAGGRPATRADGFNTPIRSMIRAASATAGPGDSHRTGAKDPSTCAQSFRGHLMRASWAWRKAGTASPAGAAEVICLFGDAVPVDHPPHGLGREGRRPGVPQVRDGLHGDQDWGDEDHIGPGRLPDRREPARRARRQDMQRLLPTAPGLPVPGPP
jgi:RNA polymerase sigma-B factor